jgi:dTMP kinase
VKSLFISFEGIECSGKSTQIELLKNAFATNIKVHVFREPGATKLGEKIRSILLNSQESLNPLSELLLFLSARAHLTESQVRPLLAQENNLIILDRYLDSSIAYQGALPGLTPQKILDLHLSWDSLNLLPTKTFFLDIELETSWARMTSRLEVKDNIEKRNKEYFGKVLSNYRALTKEQRFEVIDGNQDKLIIHDLIKSSLKQYL